MTSSGLQASFQQIAKPGVSSAPLIIPTNVRASLSPATQDYSHYLSIQRAQGQDSGSSYGQQGFNSISESSRGVLLSANGSIRASEFGSAKNSASTFPHSHQQSPYVPHSARFEESSFYQQRSSLNVGGAHAEVGRVVETREGRPTVVEVRQGQAKVVDVIERESKVINEKVIQGETRVVNEREIKRERVSQTREIRKETITTDVVRANKTIELVKEVGVPRETYVDVVYDVIVDVPIERTIEREVITEVVVEKPIEKVIEVVVEQEIEVPYEKVIEVPVEMKREVQVPVERVVHVPFDVVRENIQYREKVVDIDEADLRRFGQADQVLPTEVDYRYKERVVERPVYVDNIIEKDRVVERKYHVEVPRYNTVVKNVPVEIVRPVPHERIVYQEIEVPVVNEVIVEKEIVVEKPVFRENIIEKPVEVFRYVEREVPVPVEVLVERPVFVENTIEKKFDNLVEIPMANEVVSEVFRDEFTQKTLNVERVNGREVEKVLYRPVTRVSRVEVPLDIEVAKFVGQVVRRSIGKQVNRFVENPVEQVTEVPSYVQRTFERPVIVERTVEIPVETVSENVIPVQKIVERSVIIDMDVIRHVEQIVVRDVEVPVERIVEVEVEIKVERPVIRETLVEEEVLIEGIFEEFDDNYELHEEFEHEDEEIAVEIDAREGELNAQVRQNNSLKNEFLALQRELSSIHDNASAFEQSENELLRGRLADLQNRIRLTEELRANLRRRIAASSGHKTIEFRRDPKAASLMARLKSLIGENNVLADQVARTGEHLRQTVSESQRRSETQIKESRETAAFGKNSQYFSGAREQTFAGSSSHEQRQVVYRTESHQVSGTTYAREYAQHGKPY